MKCSFALLAPPLLEMLSHPGIPTSQLSGNPLRGGVRTRPPDLTLPCSYFGLYELNTSSTPRNEVA